MLNTNFFIFNFDQKVNSCLEVSLPKKKKKLQKTNKKPPDRSIKENTKGKKILMKL